MSSTHTSPSPEKLAPTYAQPPRKMASTGGGRAWSEEEESYLIETRQHKMPYKHIAAHLNKTELACRLHYHQLSFGTKRRGAAGRRRTSSVSSARSSASAHSHISNPADAMAVQQRPLPQLSPPASPRRSQSRSQSPLQYVPQPGAQVPILPKPHPYPSAFGPSNALRLITADVERYEARNRVDTGRLARCYDAHRAQFWTAVARDYGDGAAPHVLEDVWWRQAAGGQQVASHFPPTPPNRSPQQEKTVLPHLQHGPAPSVVEIPPTATFHAVNHTSTPPTAPRSTNSTPAPASARSSSGGAFNIASLLTEDKEIRSTTPQLPSVAAH